MIEIEIAGPTNEFQPVRGKLDSGAFRTVLNVATAKLLGIGDITRNPLGTDSAESASGHEIRFYIHPIQIRIKDGTNRPIVFVLNAAFSEDIQRICSEWIGSVTSAWRLTLNPFRFFPIEEPLQNKGD